MRKTQSKVSGNGFAQICNWRTKFRSVVVFISGPEVCIETIAIAYSRNDATLTLCVEKHRVFILQNRFLLA